MATPSAITAELQRKKNLGIKPTDPRNMAEYNRLVPQPVKTTQTTTPNKSPITAAVNNTTPMAAKSTVTPVATNQSAISAALTPTVQTTPFQFTAYKPFEYNQADIEADPIYQAAVRTAQGNIQTGQNNTLARLVANGQGNSSYASTVAQQIANKEMANVNDNLLPTLIEQAYKRHVDNFNMNNQVEGQNYGVGRDQTSDNFREWELTGKGMSQQARNLIGQVLNEKQNYKNATDQTGRDQANVNANAIRSALASLGYDPSMFGSDRTFEQAQTNYANAGIKTLAGRNQEFGEGVTMAELTGMLPDGTPTTAEQQRQLQNEWMVAEQTGAITPTLAKIYGLKAGTPTKAAKEFAMNYALDKRQVDISQQNANTSSAGLALSRDRFNYDKEQDAKKGPNYNYETDPDFADAVQGAMNDPDALANFKKNAGLLISKFGREGYDALIEYATPKKASVPDLMSQLFQSP